VPTHKSFMGATEFPIQKWAIFLQGQGNQGIARRHTLSMSHKPACIA
jgi:hypothetical protein